jgi:hypothetical protein
LTHSRKRERAQNAFVTAAWSALSSEARRQLFVRRTETELTWATRWRVNAPCMLDYARRLRTEYANLDGSSRRKLRQSRMWIAYSRTAPPTELLAEVKRLDRLPDRGISLSEKVPAKAIDEYRRHKLEDDEVFLARPGLQPGETDKITRSAYQNTAWRDGFGFGGLIRTNARSGRQDSTNTSNGSFAITFMARRSPRLRAPTGRRAKLCRQQSETFAGSWS